MLRLARWMLGLALLAHGLVHLAVHPGADAYGGGRLGWDGTARLGQGAAVTTAGHALVLVVVALYAVAGIAVVVPRLLRLAAPLTGAASVTSLALLWWAWPGLTPTPEHFWRGPVVSAASLLLVPVLVLAARDASRFARSRLGHGVVATWGSTRAERAAAYPCDGLLPGASCALWRAVDVHAPVEVAYAWLGQLRVAPYSYDLVDNRGRRSPRRLDPTLPPLAPGQTIMSIFRVEDVRPGREVTMSSGNQPPSCLTYRLVPAGPGECRLVVKAVARCRTQLGAAALALGDLVMMRRQLRTLARLAAGQA